VRPHKHPRAKGLFIYDSRDIKSESLIFEIEHSSLACGPISWTNIYVCADLDMLQYTCETVLRNLIKCDLIDVSDYAQNVLSENRLDKESESTCHKDEKLIIEDWFAQIGRRIKRLNATVNGSINSEGLAKIRNIVMDYGLGDSLGMVCSLKNYLKNKYSYNLLLSQFEEQDKDPIVEKLNLPGDEKLIARAINKINESKS
jgi:hypothetical protein